MPSVSGLFVSAAHRFGMPDVFRQAIGWFCGRTVAIWHRDHTVTQARGATPATAVPATDHADAEAADGQRRQGAVGSETLDRHSEAGHAALPQPDRHELGIGANSNPEASDDQLPPGSQAETAVGAPAPSLNDDPATLRRVIRTLITLARLNPGSLAIPPDAADRIQADVWPFADLDRVATVICSVISAEHKFDERRSIGQLEQAGLLQKDELDLNALKILETLLQGEPPVAFHVTPALNDKPSEVAAIRETMLAFMTVFARRLQIGPRALPYPDPDHLVTVVCEEISRRFGFATIQPLSQLLEWGLIDFVETTDFTPTMRAIIERVLRESPAVVPEDVGRSRLASETQRIQGRIVELQTDPPVELTEDEEVIKQLLAALSWTDQRRPQAEQLLPGALGDWDFVEKTICDVVSRCHGLWRATSLISLREQGLLRHEDFYGDNALTHEILQEIQDADKLHFMNHLKMRLRRHMYATPPRVVFPPACEFPEEEVLERIICEEVLRQANLPVVPTTILQLRRQQHLTDDSFISCTAEVIAILPRLLAGV